MTGPWLSDRRLRNRDTGWLDVLIEAFEEAEMLHHLPCDEKLLHVVRARLESPAVLRARKILNDYQSAGREP